MKTNKEVNKDKKTNVKKSKLNKIFKKPQQKLKPSKNQTKKILKKKFKKSNEKPVKILVNLTETKSNDWKKIIEETSKKSKQIKELREKRLAKKGITLKPQTTTTTNSTSTESSKIWFEVDSVFLPEKEQLVKNDQNTTVTVAKLTRAIAIDCEMVGVGENGKESILARVSIVNQYGECVYDKYVQPTEAVIDYRTHVSGIRPEDLKKHNAHPFKIVQKEVAELIEGRILVGHALHNDLQCLLLSHPKKKLRDTQKCKMFRRKHPSIGSLTSLKNLVKLLLGIDIQVGEHNSVQDAQAAMRLYTTFKKEWEEFLKERKSVKGANNSGKQDEELKPVVGQVSTETDGITVKTGNDNHKRYVKNKLKRRINKNKFLKK